MTQRLPIADIEFISDFAAFCRTKGDEGYVYSSHRNCALSQFLRDTGRAQNPSCNFSGWGDGEDADWHPLPYGLDHAPGTFAGKSSGALTEHPWTFSALADRLEALISDAPAIVRATS